MSAFLHEKRRQMENDQVKTSRYFEMELPQTLPQDLLCGSPNRERVILASEEKGVGRRMVHHFPPLHVCEKESPHTRPPQGKSTRDQCTPHHPDHIYVVVAWGEPPMEYRSRQTTGDRKNARNVLERSKRMAFLFCGKDCTRPSHRGPAISVCVSLTHAKPHGKNRFRTIRYIPQSQGDAVKFRSGLYIVSIVVNTLFLENT